MNTSIKMPKFAYKDVGERLKSWVEENFESIAAFGRATGKNSQFWYQYFNGSRRPGPDTQELLRLVNCDIEYIMTGNERGKTPPGVREQTARYDDKEIAKLRKKVAELEIENTTLRRALAPEIIQIILDGIKRKARMK